MLFLPVIVYVVVKIADASIASAANASVKGAKWAEEDSAKRQAAK